MRGAALGLLLLGLAVAAPAAPPRGEEALRRDLLRTWVHGLDERDARAVASESDVPALLRLLADPAFERPDNAAAVLAHLAGEEAVPVLEALARRAPEAAPSPERDRARLSLPRVLGAVARREGGGPAVGALEALSTAAGPDLPRLAGRELRRLGERPARPAAPARPLDGLAPAAADPAERVQAARLTWANHADLQDPMTSERLALALGLANTRMGRADFAEDAACCVQLEGAGPPAVFGRPGDGLDVIDDAADFEAVRADSSARVKVVRLIGHCFGRDSPAYNIGGCAENSGDSMIVVRYGSVTVEGLIWWHEYGHNSGIADHDPDDRYLMSAVTGFQDVALRPGQCAKLHAPERGTAIALEDRGACTDLDGDQVQDGIDNCPSEPNFDQRDPDGDGLGDPCDGDDDGDGVPDGEDACPGEDDGADPDGDGVPACLDGCPDNPFKTEPGACGCEAVDLDADGDGILNCDDGCPFDPEKAAPGTCGCGASDADSDGDGVPDCEDGCPEDPAKTAPGTCGCGFGEQDRDADGRPDCEDGCPDDPAKTVPGACGCGEPEGDADGDGAADCVDECDADPFKAAAGDCGCGAPELDADADGEADCLSCVLGDAWPPEGDGVVGLADYAALRRRAGLAGAPASAEPPRCLDLAPLAGSCAGGTRCAGGGDGLDAQDVALVRGLAAGLSRIECASCPPAPATGPEHRRPGDVAPRGGAGAAPEQVGDGRVDVADVLQLLRWAVDLDGAPGAEELLRADLSPTADLGEGRFVVGEGRLDVGDVLLALRAAVGLETLRWPARELALELVADGEAVAVSVRLDDWPAWAEAFAAAGTACAGDPAAGVDTAPGVAVLTCASDPAVLSGAADALRLRYRAPEPLPAAGDGAPRLSAQAVDADLTSVPVEPR